MVGCARKLQRRARNSAKPPLGADWDGTSLPPEGVTPPGGVWRTLAPTGDSLVKAKPSALLPAALVTLLAPLASAMGLCDPGGHFCLRLETTSARVCAPLRPAGLNATDCQPGDGELRENERRAAATRQPDVKVVDQLVVRFDEWSVMVTVARVGSVPEVEVDGAGAEMARVWKRTSDLVRKDGWMAEPVGTATLSRVGDVQVVRGEARSSSAGVDGIVLLRTVGFEVRARDATYVVVFQSAEREAVRLGAYADAAMASIDAVPARSPAGAATSITWLLRGLLAAVVLAAVAVWMGRRRARGAGRPSSDVWPR
jgi:hypothetical protein